MSQPQAHAGAWSTIGGHPALDLCNTASWRLDPVRHVDRLSTPTALVDWFCTVIGSPFGDQLGQQLPDGAIPARHALRQVRELRDGLTRVIDAQLGFTVAEPADVDHLAGAWRNALAVAGTRAELPWEWAIAPTSPDRLVHALALSVGELVHRPDLSGLRRCDGEGCGWLFIDTTRNHSRRWCDPLDCGNRARVRKYTERRKANNASSFSEPGSPSTR
jgi:predicted RNA-binding Zn ribbon-like protein